MKTRHGVALVLMAAVLAPLSAVALDGSDTMGTWLGSSEQDRSRALDDLRAKNSKLRQADRSGVMACMNAAAAIPGHRDLRIGEVAEACSEPQSPAPGGPQTDI